MNFQTMVNNSITSRRAEEMLNSEQLTIGELLLKLEAVKNKDLPIVFDDPKYKPTGFSSWRGSYCELSINYEDGGSSYYEQPKPDCKLDEFGDHDYKCPCGGSEGFHTKLPEKPTAKDFMDMLNALKGKIMVGYKGGDFTMGKSTPVWVANYGTSSGFAENDDYDSQAVVDIQETPEVVIIVTKLMGY